MTEVDALIRLLVATLLGAILGLEREITGKPAGLRTHMLVAEGAALFMVGSLLLTNLIGPDTPNSLRIDIARVASTIVTGVGFLGAGMILRSRDRIFGLTTAAGIWVAAAIGMLTGAGYFLVAIFGTAIALVTLLLVHLFEKWLKLPQATYDFEETER